MPVQAGHSMIPEWTKPWFVARSGCDNNTHQSAHGRDEAVFPARTFTHLRRLHKWFSGHHSNQTPSWCVGTHGRGEPTCEKDIKFEGSFRTLGFFSGFRLLQAHFGNKDRQQSSRSVSHLNHKNYKNWILTNRVEPHPKHRSPLGLHQEWVLKFPVSRSRIIPHRFLLKLLFLPVHHPSAGKIPSICQYTTGH